MSKSKKQTILNLAALDFEEIILKDMRKSSFKETIDDNFKVNFESEPYNVMGVDLINIICKIRIDNRNVIIINHQENKLVVRLLKVGEEVSAYDVAFLQNKFDTVAKQTINKLLENGYKKG